MYRGQSVLIPLGGGGLVSDFPQAKIAPMNLIEAKNVTLVNGYCEKHPGSRRWNKTNPVTGATNAISGGVQTFVEAYSGPIFQRILALSKTGNLYKFNSEYESIQLTAESGSPSPLIVENTAHIAIGGNELPGGSKKAFVFSGGSQVQVVVGDGTTYRNITKPAFDWSTSFPTYGLIYRSRLWCFGNASAPDFLYASVEGNQEDFQTTVNATDSQFYDVGAGEGDGIAAIFVFKNRLFIVKKPFGLYQLNDSDPSPANWYITRVNADFGVASPHSIAQVFDDVLLMNTQGSVTSLAAAFQFGDISSADIFTKLAVERYFRQEISGFGLPETYGLYYQDKKQVYFTYQSKSSTVQDGIVVLDMFGQGTQVSVLDKDQPNCLGLIKDPSGISRPFYGADDGYIYDMDSADRQVFFNNDPYVAPFYWLDGYVENNYYPYNFIAQTPHMDFVFADVGMATRTKRYEFLELTFQPTGDWNVDVDVYIDSEYKETISYNLLRDRPLAATGSLSGFVLDEDRLDADIQKSLRKPLHGQGRTISFKLRSNGLSQNIKLQSLQVSFKVSDERQIKDLRT